MCEELYIIVNVCFCVTFTRVTQKVRNLTTAEKSAPPSKQVFISNRLDKPIIYSSLR